MAKGPPRQSANSENQLGGGALESLGAQHAYPSKSSGTGKVIEGRPVSLCDGIVEKERRVLERLNAQMEELREMKLHLHELAPGVTKTVISTAPLVASASQGSLAEGVSRSQQSSLKLASSEDGVVSTQSATQVLDGFLRNLIDQRSSDLGVEEEGKAIGQVLNPREQAPHHARGRDPSQRPGLASSASAAELEMNTAGDPASKAVCSRVFHKASSPSGRQTSSIASQLPLPLQRGRAASARPSTASSGQPSTGPRALRPCPHCGRAFRLSAYSTHVNVCQSVFPTHDMRAGQRSPRASQRSPSRDSSTEPLPQRRLQGHDRRACSSQDSGAQSLSPVRSCPLLGNQTSAPIPAASGLALDAPTSAVSAGTSTPCVTGGTSSGTSAASMTRGGMKAFCEERASRLDRARLSMKMTGSPPPRVLLGSVGQAQSSLSKPTRHSESSPVLRQGASPRNCRHRCSLKKVAVPNGSHKSRGLQPQFIEGASWGSLRAPAEPASALVTTAESARSLVLAPLQASTSLSDAGAQPADEDLSSYLTSLPVLALASACASESEFIGRFPEQLQSWAAGVWSRCSEFQHVQEKLQEVRDQGQQQQNVKRRWRNLA